MGSVGGIVYRQPADQSGAYLVLSQIRYSRVSDNLVFERPAKIPQKIEGCDLPQCLSSHTDENVGQSTYSARITNKVGHSLNPAVAKGQIRIHGSRSPWEGFTPYRMTPHPAEKKYWAITPTFVSPIKEIDSDHPPCMVEYQIGFPAFYPPLKHQACHPNPR